METREKWIDNARGMGILLVMIGHLSVVPGFIVDEVYTFHIPLFFFLSGYLYSWKKFGGFREMLGYKAKKLLIPYLCLGILLPCYETGKMLLMGIHKKEMLLWPISSYIVQRRYGTIWFLSCLFVTEIVFYLLVKICKDRKMIILGICAVIACCGLLYYRMGGTTLPWNVDASCIAIFFFAVGYFIRGNEWIQMKCSRAERYWGIVLCLCAVGNVLFGFLSDKVSGAYHIEMYYCTYGMPLFTFVSAMCGIYFVILVAKHIRGRADAYIGKNSLVYFILHQTICFDLFTEIFNRIPKGWSYEMNGILQFLFVMGLSLLSLTGLNWILEHSRLRFVLGR